jgi:hypothetical protein
MGAQGVRHSLELHDDRSTALQGRFGHRHPLPVRPVGFGVMGYWHKSWIGLCIKSSDIKWNTDLTACNNLFPSEAQQSLSQFAVTVVVSTLSPDRTR